MWKYRKLGISVDVEGYLYPANNLSDWEQKGDVRENLGRSPGRRPAFPMGISSGERPAKLDGRLDVTQASAL